MDTDNPDGTKVERLTQIGADSSVPAWSKDGTYIAFFEATGIYLLDREKNEICSVSHARGHGSFDWRWAVKPAFGDACGCRVLDLVWVDS